MLSDVFARVESKFNHLRSVVHDPSARVAAISAVDKEVGAAMRLLHSLRNALAPISLLPPEVLSRVFHFILPPVLQHPGEQRLDLIRATHVCRLWRQVALGDSSLWARISGAPIGTEWISEMLVRAMNAPLDISLHVGRSNPEVLIMLSSHLSHSRELRLFGMSEFYFESFRGIFSQEAPTLELLKLCVSSTFPITFRELDGTTLFKGRAPKLRTLSLIHIIIPWSLIPRGRLKKLEISLNDESSIFNVPLLGDLNQLVDLLVDCPELEVLNFRGCLPSQPTQFPHGQTIHLSRLSRLSLSGLSSRITNLLKMLKFPASTTLQLYCTSENASTHNDHLILPVVSAHLRSPPPFEFKSLSVTVSYMDRSLEVVASSSLPTSKIRQSQDLLNHMDEKGDEFVLLFDELPVDGNWTDLIERVCKMLPISNLEILFVFASKIVHPVNWVKLFKGCTKLTMMQAMGCGTSSLVRALTAPKVTNAVKKTKPGGINKSSDRDRIPEQPARSVDAHPHVPIFPKLTFLSLKGLDFAKNEHPSGILFDVLEKGLQQRRVVYRAPLRMLRIDNCSISPRRANALQRCVQKFHWDGVKCFVDDFEDFDGPGMWWEEFFDGTT